MSSNIVGYNKVDVTASSFDILGSQFTNIGDVDIDIQDLFSEGIAEGDRILFFNGNGYDGYTYSDITFDESFNLLGAGWQDDNTQIRANRVIVPGEAFWIRSTTSKQLTFSGEVSVTNVYSFVGGNANQLVALPVPQVVNLQDVSFKNIADGDRIQVYNGSGYDAYTYSEVTFDENFNLLGAGWQDDATQFRTDKKVNLGKGFWIKAAGTIEIGL